MFTFFMSPTQPITGLIEIDTSKHPDVTITDEAPDCMAVYDPEEVLDAFLDGDKTIEQKEVFVSERMRVALSSCAHVAKKTDGSDIPSTVTVYYRVNKQGSPKAFDIVPRELMPLLEAREEVRKVSTDPADIFTQHNERSVLRQLSPVGAAAMVVSEIARPENRQAQGLLQKAFPEVFKKIMQEIAQYTGIFNTETHRNYVAREVVSGFLREYLIGDFDCFSEPLQDAIIAVVAELFHLNVKGVLEETSELFLSRIEKATQEWREPFSVGMQTKSPEEILREHGLVSVFTAQPIVAERAKKLWGG